MSVVEEEAIPPSAGKTADEYSDQHRHVKYYKSQSLRFLLERDLAVEDHDIIRLSGKRNVDETKYDIPFYGYDSIDNIVTPVEIRREFVPLDYDRKDDGVFPRDDIVGWLDEDSNEDIYDIPVEELVVRVENDDLWEQLWSHIRGSVYSEYGELIDDHGEFQQPFYYVFEAAGYGIKSVKRNIEDFHEKRSGTRASDGMSRYFLTGESVDSDGNRGLGWKYRTLDLKEIWSHKAFTKSSNVVAISDDSGRMTMRDIEREFVNHVSTKNPEYGAVNRPIFTKRIKNCFHEGLDEKRFEWEEKEGWVQVG